MKLKINSFFKKKSLYPFFLKLFGHIGKRQRFILSTVLLTTLILVSSFFSFDQVLYFFVLLLVCVYAATFFSILEGIDGAEWLMLFLVPVMFTLSFYFFYFFLPGRWLTRLPYVTMYAVSIYAILLSSNIFNVGATKNLQLFRAAFSVNFLYITFTCYLISNLILSFSLYPIYNLVLFCIFLFPLSFQFLWSIDPRVEIKPELKQYASVVTLIIAETALVFSFVPVKATVLSLFLTALFYSLSGLFHAHIENRLFRDRVREYVFVLCFVVVIVLLSIQWG